MENIKQIVGARFKEERQRLNYTQPYLGELVGAKKRTIFAWENGLSSPSAVQLESMYRVGLDVSYIITGVRYNHQKIKHNISITDSEKCLLSEFRNASEALKKSVIDALSINENHKK